MPALRRTLTYLTLLAISCNATAQGTASMEGWPEWLIEAMANEGKVKKLREVSIPDAGIATRMPGKPAKPEAFDGGWHIATDVGGQVPVQCYVYPSSMDLATFTQTLSENNMVQVAALNNAEAGNPNVFYLDAGATAGFPWLALERVYVVNTQPQPLVGFTKVRAATRGELSLACVHNEVGYRETFARVFTEFVTNIEYAAAASEPYYEEIVTMDVAGIGAGTMHVMYTDDGDGATRTDTIEATLMPVDATTLMYSDSYTVSFTDADELMINALTIDVENGEVTNNLKLDRTESGAWLSHGLLQGKEVEFEIDAAAEPVTDLNLYRRVRELFAGDEQSTAFQVWLPSADPSRLLDASIERNDGEVAGQGILKLGPMSVDGLFDESGSMYKGSMAMGPVTIQMKLAWKNGALPE